MAWRRGRVASPQTNRAIIIADDDPSDTWFQVQYINCDPEASSWDRLRKNELVVFRSTYLGNDRYAASEVLRVERLDLARLIEVADIAIQADDILVGSKDKYRLLSSLGRGATASVWKAHAVKSGQEVAVKIMMPISRLTEVSKLANIVKRFEREAEIGTALNNSKLVNYIDSGRFLSFPFLCLELCAGAVSGELSRAGALKLDHAVEIITGVTSALLELHEAGYVHRDVKPANMLVRFDGTVCLGDFGILRVDEIDTRGPMLLELTASETTLGSWFYMSPEQRRRPKEVTPKADIYSLGVSWYELLTGHVPTPEAIAAKDLPPAIPSPHPFNELILAMMSYDPANRPSARAVAYCLRFLETDYQDDVYNIIRHGLYDQRHPDPERQALAIASEVLPVLGFSNTVVETLLKAHGCTTAPPLVTPEGDVIDEAEFASTLAELAEWTVHEILSNALRLADGEAKIADEN